MDKRILVVGAGALGCSSIPGLEEHGQLTVIDGDKVERKNLRNQKSYKESDIGRWKVEALKDTCPSILPVNQFITPSLFAELGTSTSLVVDLADDLHLTMMLDQLCSEHGIPLLVGAVHQDQGQVYALRCKTDVNGRSPAYSDLFKGKPSQEQDHCDMRAIPTAVIEAVGKRVVERASGLLNEQQLDPFMDMYLDGSWQQMSIASNRS
jgi:molybdopterin/thiamine biosynthesis adenylyltransferase